jgi:hypothetical protein
VLVQCCSVKAPVGPRVEGARSEGGSSQEAIAPRPITNSNFVPSRSKTFDAQRSGNFYGYRRMPEMHSSMTLAQLQDIVHLYYCQASEDFRAMNLVDTSKKPSHALLEARRHMTRGSNKFHDGNSSAMTAFNARFGTKNQASCSLHYSACCCPLVDADAATGHLLCSSILSVLLLCCMSARVVGPGH